MEKRKYKNIKQEFLSWALALSIFFTGCTADGRNEKNSPFSPTNTPALEVETPTITSIPTLGIQTPEPTKQFPTIAAITPSPKPDRPPQTNTPSTLMPEQRLEETQNTTPTPSTLQPMAELALIPNIVTSNCFEITKTNINYLPTKYEPGRVTITCITNNGGSVKVDLLIQFDQDFPKVGDRIELELRDSGETHILKIGGRNYRVKSFYIIQ